MNDDKVITNQYHIEVIKNLSGHHKFNDSPLHYLVERIVQMFPEYRDPELREKVTAELKDIACNA